MKKFSFFLSLLLAFVGVTASAQVAFEASEAPSNGEWASNTTWYRMSLDGKYLSAYDATINGDIKKTIEEGYNKYLSALKDNKIPSTMDTDRVYFSMLLNSKNAYSGITKDIFVNKEYDIDEMARPVKDIAKRVNDYVKERKLLEKGKAANDKVREKNRNETEA